MAGGWTQTPNFIMDAIPDMKPAEVQVVMAIVRQTIGWQRERISLTMGELEALTKMARASVVAGVKDALKRGVISREEDGKSYIYRITEPSMESASVQILNRCSEQPVQNLDRDTEQPVQNLNSKTPESVQILDRQSVQNLNPNKRNINTNTPEEKKGERAQAPAAPNTDVDFGGKALTPQQTMFAAICEAMGWDYRIVKRQDKQPVGELVSDLSKAGYTADDIRRFMVEVWFKDWRWEKRQERPRLKDIRQGIGALRAVLPEEMSRASPNGTSKVASSLSAVDQYAQLKAKHGVET